MQSEEVLTFLTIHRTRSFSAAANELGRTQPAISRRIALLEREIGAPLFERIGAGVALSEAGHALLPHAERLMAILRDAETAMRALRSEGGPVSLAAVGTLAGRNLTHALKAFTAAHPKADLSIRTATSAEVSELVRRGEVTIGLRYLFDPSSDLECTFLGSERLLIACAADHPLAGTRIKSLAALHCERWLAFPIAYTQRETYADNIFAQFQRVGVGAVTWTPVDSQTAQKRLIEAGLGLALLAESAIGEELRDKTIATIDAADLTAAHPIYIVIRKHGHLTSSAAALLRTIKAAEEFKDTRPRKRSRR